jgi:hypothetical protein
MILEKIKKICNEHRIPSVHSDFQIANFIIGKETSLVGKQWQCLRELQSRKDSLELVENEIEEINDNIELANLDLQKLEEKLKKDNLCSLKVKKIHIYARKQARKINQLNKGKKDLLIKKNDIEIECAMFVSIFEALTKNIGFLEYNDPKAQIEYWNQKFETELNMNSLLNLPTSADLIKSIMALPEISPVRKRTLEALTNINKKLLEKNN